MPALTEIGECIDLATAVVQKTTLSVALAESLEAAGRSTNALEVWKVVATELKSQPHSIWSERVDAAIKRLSPKR